MKQQALNETMLHSLKGTMKFPQIVGILIAEGVEAYHVDFVLAENRYYSSTGESFTVKVPHNFPKAEVEFSAAGVASAVKKSQQGLINYETFLEESARAGCVYYIVYLSGKKVIYFGRNGDSHTEHFPKPQ